MNYYIQSGSPYNLNQKLIITDDYTDEEVRKGRLYKDVLYDVKMFHLARPIICFDKHLNVIFEI